MFAEHITRTSLLSLLKQSTVDDVDGAFPKTILNFLKESWLTLSDQNTSEIFGTYREALWVSRQTMLKMDPVSGVFGKRIRARNGKSELLLALFKNMIAEFKFTPFFPDSVKGDMLIIPLKAIDAKTENIRYGLTSSFCLYFEGFNPIEFSVYLGDGRCLRDLQRMTEENADIRALKDVFGFIEDTEYNLFPLIQNQEIERYEDRLSLTLKKSILGETYQLKITITGLQGTSLDSLKILEDPVSLVFSYFVLDEVETVINEGEKGWDLLKQITQKSPEWFEKKQLRFRQFVKNGKEIKELISANTCKSTPLPHQYKRHWNFQKNNLNVVEILAPRYKIIAPETGASFKIDIKFLVETTEELYRPKPVNLSDIFTKKALAYIHFLQNAKSLGCLAGEKIMSLLNMLELSYRSLSFLIMNNTVLAGAFTYLTYFGRDTVFSHLLLKPFLRMSIQQKIVQQLLNRAHQDGEAAHEIDTRVLKGKEHHYDYRMTDTDFLMTISTFELLNEMNNEELKTFLNHKDIDNRYNVNSQRPDNLLDNATVIFRNLNHILTLIDRCDFIPLKRAYDPSSANWRDAVNSFSRGTYSYDVNAVWIPHIFHLLGYFLKDTLKKNIVFDFLASAKQNFPHESFDCIESFFHAGHEETDKKITIWTERMKKTFAISYSLEKWRAQLKNFYNDPENHDDDSIQDLKKMKIGYYLREHGQGKVWFNAEEFLDDKKWEDRLQFQFEHLEGKFFLPNGNPFPKMIRTYVMGLDKNKKPIPVLHSDLGFEAFVKSMRREKIEEELILPTELPISLGGLAIIDKNGENLGFTVANPMLSDKSGYALLLSPQEKKNGVDPQSLSPWKLLGKNAYHGWGAVWEVMIDFMVSALQDTDLQSQEYLKRHYWWLLENYTRYSRVRNREVLGFKYNSNYEDWFLTEATVEKFEINDLQAFNAAGRLRIVLKALVPGSTNFWIFKQCA
ncbi:MAG: hypothetical protein MRJ65_06385 [Candidatus Brocadiaceae bacterium]|nr:hypothetical protein [Candidatus Brocadiaceae bacterium]